MRVVMLSQNEWRHDSRVIREAEALAKAGHDVHVVARGSDSNLGVESVRNVHYHSIPRQIYESRRGLSQLAVAHLRVLALQVAPFGTRTPEAVARLAGFALTAPLAGLLLLARASTRALFRRGGAPLARLRGVALRMPLASAREHVARRALGALESIRYLDDCARACTPYVVALQPDVVHAHDLIALSAASLAAKKAGANLVYDAHELETHTNYHQLSRDTKRAICRYESTLARRCDAVVTVCDSIADWLSEHYGIDRPVVVMNAPQRITAPITSTLREVLQLERSARLVVYVGSVTVDRGLEVAVEALSHLPGVHFATVGPRYPVTEQEILRVASERSVLDRVHLVDPVPSEAVVPFIADADASVIPIQNVCLSYAYCFPNKLLESVFAGLPVVAADLVELRRFIERTGVGVVTDERDPKAVAAAIADVLERRDDLAPDPDTIGRIEDEYGWMVQERRLLHLYGSLEHPRSATTQRVPAQMAS